MKKGRMFSLFTLLFLASVLIAVSGVDVLAQPKGQTKCNNVQNRVQKKAQKGQDKVEVILRNGNIVLVPEKAAEALIKHAGAVLAAEETVTISATAVNGGSIDPSGDIEVPVGGSQTFTMTPDPGHIIEAVVIDGVNIGQVTSYTFSSVTENHTISALFIPEEPGDGDDAGGW